MSLLLRCQGGFAFLHCFWGGGYCCYQLGWLRQQQNPVWMRAELWKLRPWVIWKNQLRTNSSIGIRIVIYNWFYLAYSNIGISFTWHTLYWHHIWPLVNDQAYSDIGIIFYLACSSIGFTLHTQILASFFTWHTLAWGQEKEVGLRQVLLALYQVVHSWNKFKFDLNLNKFNISTN